MTIYRHHPGYQAARAKVQAQSLDADLAVLDSLFGRDGLKYGDGPDQVKVEALRQLEMEFRDSVDERATFYVDMAKAMKGGGS